MAKSERREQVIYSEGLIKKCSEAISQALPVKVNLSSKPRQDNRVFNCEPVGANVFLFQEVPGDPRKQWKLIPLENPGLWPCCFGINLRFEHEGKVDVLISAAVLIVLRNSNGYQPLYRAEWDYKDLISEQSNHGQPHWHALTPIAQERFNFESKEVQTFEFSELCEQIDTGIIHLAMAADWHNFQNKNHHKHNFASDNALISWLSGVIGYCIHQLSLLSDRNSGSVAREFV